MDAADGRIIVKNCEDFLDYHQIYTIRMTLMLKYWTCEVTLSDIIEDVVVHDSDDFTEVT